MAHNKTRKRLAKPARNTLSDLDKALADLASNVRIVDEVPEGWKSEKEWRELTQLGKTQTLAKMNELVATGKWERQMFKVPSKSRLPIPYYRRKPD